MIILEIKNIKMENILHQTADREKHQKIYPGCSLAISWNMMNHMDKYMNQIRLLTSNHPM
jgi:hypothetical protein